MKKQLTTGFIFSIPASIILISIITLVLAAATDTFSVTTTVSNSAPVITWTEPASDSPTAGTTKLTQIRFNASDANGQGTLNDTSATLFIRYDSTVRTSTGCAGSQINATARSYLCNITIFFYDAPGANWTITANITDSADVTTTYQNNATNFTMGNTDDITIVSTSISFTGSVGQQDVAGNPNPIVVNNTGNQIYSRINVTAFSLNSTADSIGAGNFSVNASNSAQGNELNNGTTTNVAGANILRGAGAYTNLSFYLDIPASVSNAEYASSSNWIIDPNQQ